MKKFLSLALALVMALSLVTISAGAKEFKDDSSIKYDEAVAVISAIGVVDGYTDGNFNPQNTLTRGAAAKIICNLILGPTTASALPADTAPFKDVPANHEFAGYIAYCAQQGIINGYSDGSFRPAGTLDGYSFMKMLLGALGYEGSIEGFTGANWSTNVAKLALGIGLDDDNDDFVGSKAVTREEACLYAFNALQADMVEYDSRTTVNVGGAEVTIAGSKAEKILQRDSGYKNTMNDGTSTQEPVLQFAEKYFDDLKKDDTSDDFGRPATTWKLKNEEIGTYACIGDLVATFTNKVTKAKIYNAIGKTVYDDLTDAKAPASLTVYMDGAVINSEKNGDKTITTPATIWVDKNDTGRIGNGKTTATNNGNGTLTEVYVDDDSNTTIVMINTYVFQATEDYSASKEEVKIADAGDSNNTVTKTVDGKIVSTSITVPLTTYTLDIDDSDDFDITDVKEDDYILINAVKNSDGRYEPKIAVVAEQVSGNVDSYTVNDSVTVDGTDYSYATTTLDDGEVKGEINSADSDVVLVLDAYGYVIAVDESNGTGNYVFISATDKSALSSNVKANAYFVDGTNAEITLKKVDKSTTTSKLMAAKGWYTYSKDSNDKYTLIAISGSKYATETSFEVFADCELTDNGLRYLTTNGKTKLAKVGETEGVRANADTVFVIEDADGDIDVYTGVKNVPDTKLAPTYVEVEEDGVTKSKPVNAIMGYVYKTDGKYATYVFISLKDTNSKIVDSASDDSYIFVIAFDKTLGDKEDTYYRYKAIQKNEEGRWVETKILTDDKDYDLGLYSKIKKSASTGRITGMDPVDIGEPNSKCFRDDMTAVKVAYSSGILSIGRKDYSVDSDTEIVLFLDYKYGSPKDEDIQAIMTDADADYQIDGNITASSLKSILSGYTVSGEFYAITDDDRDDSDTLDYLFVHVDGATPIA